MKRVYPELEKDIDKYMLGIQEDEQADVINENCINILIQYTH